MLSERMYREKKTLRIFPTIGRQWGSQAQWSLDKYSEISSVDAVHSGSIVGNGEKIVPSLTWMVMHKYIWTCSTLFGTIQILFQDITLIIINWLFMYYMQADTIQNYVVLHNIAQIQYLTAAELPINRQQSGRQPFTQEAS